MRQALILLTLILLTGCSSQIAESRKTAEQTTTPPNPPAKRLVLIELYTSEG